MILFGAALFVGWCVMWAATIVTGQKYEVSSSVIWWAEFYRIGGMALMIVGALSEVTK